MSFLSKHPTVSLHPVCTCFLCLHLTVSFFLIYFPLSLSCTCQTLFTTSTMSLYMFTDFSLCLHPRVSQWIIHQCHFFVYIFGLVFTLFVHVSFVCIFGLVFLFTFLCLYLAYVFLCLQLLLSVLHVCKSLSSFTPSG